MDYTIIIDMPDDLKRIEHDFQFVLDNALADIEADPELSGFFTDNPDNPALEEPTIMRRRMLLKVEKHFMLAQLEVWCAELGTGVSPTEIALAGNQAKLTFATKGDAALFKLHIPDGLFKQS